MKIPKIIKLPSGMYNCQIRLKGQSISITDANRDIVEAKAYAYKSGMKKKVSYENITVYGALTKYIKSRDNIVSPSTVAGYNTIVRTRFKALQPLKIANLDAMIVQNHINEEATLCSPKTLRNAWSLTQSAIAYVGGERYNPTLPIIPEADMNYLTTEQIPIFLEALKGQPFEVAALLALWSCRRSEVLGLHWEDVDFDNRLIYICRARVVNKEGVLVDKSMPKNNASIRYIPMSDQLYDALLLTPEEERNGYVVDLPKNGLYDRINKLCRANGLPEIGVHGLRHSFASVAYHLRVPEKATMRLGGWKNDIIMKRIYTKLSDADAGKFATDVTNFFDESRG